MTKGAYVVEAQDAERVLEAVTQRDAHVLVRADLTGGGEFFASIRLVVAHVIAVIENKNDDRTRHFALV